MRRKFAALGIVAEAGQPQDVANFIRQDVTRWSAIIRERHIQSD